MLCKICFNKAFYKKDGSLSSHLQQFMLKKKSISVKSLKNDIISSYGQCLNEGIYEMLSAGSGTCEHSSIACCYNSQPSAVNAKRKCNKVYISKHIYFISIRSFYISPISCLSSMNHLLFIIIISFSQGSHDDIEYTMWLNII